MHIYYYEYVPNSIFIFVTDLEAGTVGEVNPLLKTMTNLLQSLQEQLAARQEAVKKRPKPILVMPPQTAEPPSGNADNKNQHGNKGLFSIETCSGCCQVCFPVVV